MALLYGDNDPPDDKVSTGHFLHLGVRFHITGSMIRTIIGVRMYIASVVSALG